MPLYYFHLASKAGLIEADEPLDLANLETAKVEALEAARDLAAQAVSRGENGLWDAVIVADEHGHRVHEIPLEAALPPRFQREKGK